MAACGAQMREKTEFYLLQRTTNKVANMNNKMDIWTILFETNWQIYVQLDAVMVVLRILFIRKSYILYAYRV